MSLQDPWSLTVGGEDFHGLNHSALMWYVSRAAIERGISPEALRQHFARDRPRRWMSIPGQLGLEEFRSQAIGVVPDIDRYQVDEDDDLFSFDGRTWALTNQLGAHTGDYARSIGAAYPQLGLELHPSKLDEVP